MITYEKGNAPEDALVTWRLESDDFGNTYIIELGEENSFYVFDLNHAEGVCQAFYMSQLAHKAKLIFEKEINVTKSSSDFEIANWLYKYKSGSFDYQTRKVN